MKILFHKRWSANRVRVATGLILALVAGVVLPQRLHAQAVVPNAFENSSGGGTFLGPLANAPRTYQSLIHESQLVSLLNFELTGLSWRLPIAATEPWPASLITFNNFDIYLSQGVTPADRSLTFANNVAGPQTQVRSGLLTIPTGAMSSGNNPNSFDLEIGFNSWLYSGGHLLIELRHSGFSGTSRSVDAVAASNTAAGYGTLFSAAWTGSYTGTSGSQGNFSVTRLTTSGIPEPTCGTVLGLLSLAALGRRRK
jgi:hypothetical protein